MPKFGEFESKIKLITWFSGKEIQTKNIFKIF
jgi:hypothetical protein